MDNLLTAITKPEKDIVSGLYGLVLGDGDGDDDEKSKSFHHLFPKRQVFVPRQPYPMWDSNWAGGAGLLQPATRRPVRHILLIRHGQYYEENHNEPDRKVLTKLGKRQARACGQRLREMIEHNNKDDGGKHKCKVNVMVTSSMIRAKQTGEIIAQELDGLNIKNSGHDPLLDEGHPAHCIPSGEYTKHDIERVDRDHPRVEKAFQKYFCNSRWHDKEELTQTVQAAVEKLVPTPTPPAKDEHKHHQHLEDKHHDGEERIVMANHHHHHSGERQEHEFQLMVTHSNVIRYLACRALQLPPEAWLRFNLFNTSVTYLVVHSWGNVSCRMIGDVGHLKYDEMSISENTGFQWE